MTHDPDIFNPEYVRRMLCKQAESNAPSLATSSGHPSARTITERINGVELMIVFEYNFTGEYTIVRNIVHGDAWELESSDVRRQIEHAVDVSLERNGRL